MLEKHSFLQINATLVAGLLILLTITAISTESILDLKIKSNILLNEYHILLEDYPQIKKNIEITEGRQNITTTPSADGDGIVFSIPPPPPALYAQNSIIDEIFEDNYRDRIKIFAEIKAYDQLSNFEFIYANPVLLVSMMIIPFLGSMIVETIRWRANHYKTSWVSMLLFILGISIMLAFFGAGLIFTLLYK